MQRLAARCADCAFENPRGWVSCARCGALLGPRLRRDDDSESGTTQTVPAGQFVQTDADAVVSDGADSDERTHVIKAPSADGTAIDEPISAQTDRWTTDARPLIGQDDAIARLQLAIAAAFSAARPRLITLQGPSGSGKTRMLHRASELAAGMCPDVSIHYAALRSRDDGPYAPFSRLLLDRFGVTPASSPSLVREELAGTLVEVLEDSEAAALAQLVGHVAGIPFPDGVRLRELQEDPKALHDHAVAAVARLADGDAGRCPTLWLLDDLTDADDAAFELLAAVLRAQSPLVVVATGAAPLAQRAAALGQEISVDHIDLLPLRASHIEQLARALIPALGEFPAEVAEELLNRSLGNPRDLVALFSTLDADTVTSPLE